MNEKYKQDFIRAGALAKEVRLFGKTLIQQGASYNAVVSQIRDKIRALGAIPAFPPQLALNDVAAHFLPFPDQDILFSNELVKLDIGVCYNGAIGDCAVTVDLSGKYQKLIDAAEAALLAAEQSIHVGMRIGEIGSLIEETIHSFGLKPVRNLCGHGLAKYKVHTHPLIPNCADPSNIVIKSGMTFAIEPFATNGVGKIFEKGKPTIFSFVSERPIRSPLARALIEKILSFHKLPFAIHDLIDGSLSLTEIKQGIEELLQAGILLGYPPLVEEGQGLVAQAENSVLIDSFGKVFITTR